MHAIDTFVSRFTIVFRGTHIVVTPNLISKVLCVPRADHLDYPNHHRLSSISKDELASLFCEKAMLWGGTLNFSTFKFAKGPRILNMVMTFVLTPQSHYNTITEPRARFLLSLMEGLSINFPSHMIVSILDYYQKIATRDKFIFPSVITRILTHMHITIPHSPFFHVMGAISKESIQRSAAQLATKWPCMETTNATSSLSTPSSSSRADVPLADIMKQLQHIRANFGSHLDHLFDEMCQMTTMIGCITCHQSRLGSFAPSPSLELVESSSNGGDDDGDDASCSETIDEMIVS